MSRRKSAGPPISLFSFQDIITSVTAIIILMTLLLALELLQRRFATAAVEPDAAESSDAALASEIAALEQQREQLSRQLQESTMLVDTAADKSPEELKRELEATRIQVQGLHETRKRLQQEVLKAVDDRQQARQQQIQMDRSQLAELQRHIASDRRKLAELKSSNALVFRPASDSQKRAWLLDVSESRLVVEPVGEPAERVVFDQPQLFRSARFIGWLNSLNSTHEYFLILLRPSGIKQFPNVRQQIVDGAFEFGFDLIGEQQKVVQAEDVR